jgi:PAS domain S-box-containing protein
MTTKDDDVKHLTHELRRREAYLAEAQRLSHTGSFGWRPSTNEIIWSEETFRIFRYDPTTPPTVELFLQRVHPDDVADVQRTVERATRDATDFDHEYRLLMPDGAVRYLHVVAHAVRDESGTLEFAGAAMDVTEQHQARVALERAVDEITTSQRRLRCVIDAIPVMVWSAMPDGSLEFVNERWVEYHGVSLAGLGPLGGGEALIHPEDRARTRDRWREVIAAGIPAESENRGLRADGEYRWFLNRVVPLRDERGEIFRWLGTITDIEDRKRAEMLLAGEKRLLEMIARGESGAAVLDGICRFHEELASDSLSSILLLDPKANCLRHGAAPNLPAEYIRAIDGAVIGPSAGSCGTAAYRAEPVIVSDIATDPLWADYKDLALAHGLRACWSTPILSTAGRVLGTFATYYREPRIPTPRERSVIEQITNLASIALEREQAEAKLRQSERHLAEASRLSHTGSVYTNALTGEHVWSDETYRIFEYDPSQAPASREMMYRRVHPDDTAHVRAAVGRLYAGEGVSVAFNFRLVMPDGRIKYIQGRGYLQHDAAGNREVVGAVVDVTAARHAEDALRRSEDALRQAQAELAHVTRVMTVAEIASSIGHEVNQPLAAIVMSGTAARRWLDADPPRVAEAREAVQGIISDGNRASQVIDHIRTMLRKGEPEMKTLNVNDMIHETLMLTRSELARHRVAFLTELSEELPLVVGDRVQLQQVLVNLMLNGADAMSAIADRPRLLTLRSRTNGSGGIVMDVADTGIGLAAASRDRMFDAFFSTKPHGLGMGLSISRSIIEAHGGQLWATANDGPGATMQYQRHLRHPRCKKNGRRS